MNEITEQDFKTWLELKGLSPRSIKEYAYYFNKLEELSQAALINLLRRYNNNISRAFLKNLIIYIKTTPLSQEVKQTAQTLEIPKQTGRAKKRIPKVLSKDQILNIVRACPNERTKLMILVMFKAGLRLSELVNIKPYDFNLKDWYKNPEQDGRLRIIGKGDKERILPVDSNTMKRIARYFIERNQKKDYTAQDTLFNIGGHRFEVLLSKAGLKALGESIHPHILRHSAASYLNDNGFNIQEIQQFLGHSSITTTSIYIHVNKKELDNKLLEAFK